MTNRWSSLIAVAGTVALVCVAGGCAATPRQRPIEMGPVDVGPGSLEATRRALEGTWTLVTLEVIDKAGARRPIKAGGQLTYDAFGNMTIRGVVEDKALFETLVLDYEGRIVIDPVKKEFRAAALTSDRPADPSQIGPVSPDKVRRYELTADTFVVTYVDASTGPTAVATWTRPGAKPAPGR